ncbi:MAG: hypothetical protein KatS3mg131_1518 [Candidatus Tectimicrobiota bacterium]|nr:MAG: hypothetical protein KatS3mg131_1518 [Candidatus Tectomicrobia bacterium]
MDQPGKMGNIGPGERRRRRLLGVLSLAVSAVLGVVFLITAAAPAWRGLLFFPLWSGLLGLLQARTGT